MKFFVGLFLLFVFVQDLIASPLIFKTKKRVTTDEFTELAVIDTSKYKQIRIGVKTDYADTCRINVYAFDEEKIFILGIEKDRLSESFLIDTPPNKIKIEAKGKCNYSLYIWAQ